MSSSKYIGMIIGIIIVVLIIAVAINYIGAPSSTASANTSKPQNTTAIQNNGYSNTSTNTTSTKNLSVLYVSASGSDANSGNSSAPLNTINRAIELAKPGEAIFVEPGVYNEQVNITSNVALIGVNPNTTIINASGKMNGINIIGTGANGTIIEGITVENADNHGIYVQDAGNVEIINNIVEHNGLNATVCPQPPAKPTGPCIIDDKALELVGTHNVTVANNIVTNNLADGGIAVVDLGALNPGSLTPTHIIANATDNLIINNKVLYNKGGCGIIISSKNMGTMDNIVVNNTVEFNPAGIIVGAGAPNSNTLNNKVINNTVFNNFLPGIIVHSAAPGATISNTIIMFNKVGENGNFIAVGALNKTGILVSGDVMPVSNTIIQNNNVSNEYYGIWLRNAPNAKLLNNTVANVIIANYTK
jgi:parallel beta-helix repeat protein